MKRTTRAVQAAVLGIALLAAACGGSEPDDGAAPVDGPTITVGSFNFPESVILAEIYAQALEADGYSVERNLNLGARELVFPELENGNLDLLPEYVGSALSVGFGDVEGATGDLDATLARLRAEFEAIGVEVLEPAPGEDKNVFVVTGDFAEANGLASISDLTGIDNIVFAGPPECEGRDTCLRGLQEVYGLTNIEFQAVQEGSVRIASLENGDIDLTLLFSTQPVIAEKGFVALEDDEGMVPVENIVPVVTAAVVEAYGSGLSDLLDRVSALITTEILIDLNGRVEIDAEDPADVAAAFLADHDLK
jgi:osmoprotectant transport system substrate-binding protein